MATTKTKDLRGMSDEQLGLTLKDTEKHLFQLRFQSATDRLETPSEIRKARRDIARIKTVQRERELKKLGDLPADQLATRITSLEAKVADGRPGKRTAFRQAKRLKRFHAAKATAAPAAKKGSGK
jgi:large subunit ribosomal protein L29